MYFNTPGEGPSLGWHVWGGLTYGRNALRFGNSNWAKIWGTTTVGWLVGRLVGGLTWANYNDQTAEVTLNGGLVREVSPQIPLIQV